MHQLQTRRTLATSALLVISLMAVPALAHDEAAEEAPEPIGATEIGFSYVGTSGNTDTSSFGLDLKSARRPTPWGLGSRAQWATGISASASINWR